MIVGVRRRRTVYGHLDRGVLEDSTIDAEVVVRQELILLGLQVAE
jgi:hypothetical protein